MPEDAEKRRPARELGHPDEPVDHHFRLPGGARRRPANSIEGLRGRGARHVRGADDGGRVQLGKVIRMIPLVVIRALLFSVLESLNILPAHRGRGLQRGGVLALQMTSRGSPCRSSRTSSHSSSRARSRSASSGRFPGAHPPGPELSRSCWTRSADTRTRRRASWWYGAGHETAAHRPGCGGRARDWRTAYGQPDPNEIVYRVQIVSEHWSRSLTMEPWSYGKDHSLIRLLAPARETGTATLTADDRHLTVVFRDRPGGRAGRETGVISRGG